MRLLLSGFALAVGVSGTVLMTGCESTASARSKQPHVMEAGSVGRSTHADRAGRPPGVAATGRDAAGIEFGRVMTVESVTIAGKAGVVGTLGGAAAGGMAVRPKIYTKEDLIWGTVGAVGGAVIGRATEEALTRKPGQRVTVALEDGETAVITQDARNGLLQEGDKVKVVRKGNQGYATIATAEDREIVNRARAEAHKPAWYEVEDGAPNRR